MKKHVHLNKSQLAYAFQCSLNTIAAWQRRGCPVIRAGRPGRAASFDLAEVSAWRKADVTRYAKYGWPDPETIQQEARQAAACARQLLRVKS